MHVGGDGTLNEVVNGIAGFQQASVSCYPCGSGNDFVKYYGGKEKFLDIDKLIHASEKTIDLIKVSDRYCINVCHFGFDTCVAETVAKLKRKKIIGGKNSYIAAGFKAFIKAMRNQCKIVVDGELIQDGDMLACHIANGSYVGGSFNCAPFAVNDDGILEVCLIKCVSRLRFLSMVIPLAKGELTTDQRFKDCVVYRRGKVIEIEGPKDFGISIDGEVVYNDHFKVEVIEKAIKFAVPTTVSSSYLQQEQEAEASTCPPDRSADTI
ncbi:MAG: diacylglycerol/lipid kinase family protein [Thermacetogeniaceae bacterium]|jgi:diacylglycerol kinase (ATP)